MTIKLNRKSLGYLSSFLILVSLVLFGVLKSYDLEYNILGKYEEVTSYSGFEVLLGITEKSESIFGMTIVVELSTFNWILFATYIIGVVSMLSLLINKKGARKFGVIALLITTVLIFLSPLFIEMFMTDDLEIDGVEDNISRIEITIYEGKNRQVRRMFEYVGANVIFLKRTKIGDLKLGGLGRGMSRYLTDREIAILQRL